MFFAEQDAVNQDFEGKLGFGRKFGDGEKFDKNLLIPESVPAKISASIKCSESVGKESGVEQCC